MSRKVIVAVDFDGTIVEHEYPYIGHLRKDAADTLRWLHTWAHIIIWTCRSGDDLAEMREFLDNANIPYDSINENAPFSSFQPSPKIFYDLLIDDRNIGGIQPWSEIRVMLEKYKNHPY